MSGASGGGAAPKICFNSQCKELRLEAPWRKGWRLRSGELADLCNRCSSSYEQGSFCESFHPHASGWRNCESCGKRLHCGCIVSAQAYLFLDAGGVECISCARKAFAAAPKQAWSPHLPLPLQLSEKKKDIPVRSWNASFPGQWRQASTLWNVAGAQSDLHKRISYEFDRPNSNHRVIAGGRMSVSIQERRPDDLCERKSSSNLNTVVLDRVGNGNANSDSHSGINLHREENADVMQESGSNMTDDDLLSTRIGVILDPTSTGIDAINVGAHPNHLNSLPSSYIKDDPSSSAIGLAAPFSSPSNLGDAAKISTIQPPYQTGSPSLVKQMYSNHQIVDPSCEVQAQMRNGRPRMDARSRGHLLPRYWPRITDQELQQISGNSNSVITPLFEKILSASDAGRIGRLVLPKKCAEAYFPVISQPEGLPLKVQDVSGKEWTFQFRFWPNNNSRMYVLEGVTPCIQSMQLQAGDTVTFSRIDPEGKLVMGFRKALSVATEEDIQKSKDGNSFSTPAEVTNRNPPVECTVNLPLRPSKGSSEPRNPIPAPDHLTHPKFNKEGFIQKDLPNSNSSPALIKRKGNAVGAKNKRLRIENADSMELHLSWEEAQGLLCPAPNHIPSVVVIEGLEIEEYEEAPILGKPTIFATDQAGSKIQWAQCEECFKWRKLPVDAILPSRWTCADNKWDPERSSCSSPEELSMEQLVDLLPSKSGASRKSKAKVKNENIDVEDGLDTLAKLAILSEGDALPSSSSSSQATTRHPRHRPGCSCIVCIQPPSGKGPKHKQTCTCNVCQTVKRRFRTLMMRREKRQTEKETETAQKKQQLIQQSPELLPQSASVPLRDKSTSDSPQTPTIDDDGVAYSESERSRTLPSPLKTQIDLNIQPDRDEEPSPVSSAGNLMRLLRDSAA